MPVLSTDLKKLDSKLDKIERKFNKKLESYYNDIEKSVTRQVSGYKKSKDFIIPTSKVQGLEKLFRQHFKDVQAVAAGHTRRELLYLAKTDEERDKIRLLSANKLSKSNLNYAQKLAKKQVQDFEDKIKAKLDNAIKLDSTIKIAEMKKIISDESLGFKNVRTIATSTTEACRVSNETKLIFYSKLGITKVMYVMTRTERDNKGKQPCRCPGLNGRVFRIGSDELKENQPPIHANCACQLVSIS